MRFLYDGELLDLPSSRVDRAADVVLLAAAGSVIELRFARMSSIFLKHGGGVGSGGQGGYSDDTHWG